ncbi:hypothetical protein ACROYT_G004298 [Oculina patagonica]
MRLWILSLVCTAVYGISRISGPNLKAVNFAQAIEGHKLNGSVIKEVEVDSESSCQFECVEEERCQSYNFATTKNNDERFKCQLSDSDRFHGHVYFEKDQGFIYKGLQVPVRRTALPVVTKASAFLTTKMTAYDASVTLDIKESLVVKSIETCAQLLQDDFIASTGVYTINPDGGKPIQVFCDMTTDGGGWTVFQKRVDGSVDFYLGWESYKNGFGDLNGEFWLGNDNLHRLTAADDVMLRVDLEDFDGNITYAKYTTFKLADEGDKYRLLIGGYSGTAGDSMGMSISQPANNMQFSTKDNENDLWSDHCARVFKGAWWYSECHNSNLNGLYLNGSHSSFADGINWITFRGQYYSLKRAEMKVKPKSLQ